MAKAKAAAGAPPAESKIESQATHGKAVAGEAFVAALSEAKSLAGRWDADNEGFALAAARSDAIRAAEAAKQAEAAGHASASAPKKRMRR